MAKFLRLIITLNLILMSALAWADTTKDTNTDYQLSSGDVISITVFAEPDLSFESLKLNDAGSFSYPFLGEVNAQGLTALQLQNKIAAKLKGDYLVNPKVSVSILEYRQFYISGEVKKPGGYPYQPGLTVRRAAALAGGLTERASERRMTIIREADKNKKPKYVSMEDRVMPGDTITVGQGFF